ncbi:leucine-rich repeat domain-containing protein [Chryseobacterium sp. M5A1_1a]
MKTKEELKLYFENGDKPMQEHFWEWLDSYWHKDEKIELTKISGFEHGNNNLIYAEMDVDKNASIDFFMKRKMVIKPGTLTIPREFTIKVPITEIVLPDSVTDIQDWAFSSSKLTSLHLPDSLVNISAYAFSNNQLTEIHIPSRITIINEASFSSNKIQSLNIPYGVKEIKRGAFSNNLLTSVSIPESVVNIEANAFRSNGLTQVKLGINTVYVSNSFDPEVQIIGGKLIN